MFARLWLALFIVGGVLLGCHRPELARRLARCCPLALLAAVIGLLVTGAHRVGEEPSESHRWLAHAMVIAGWIGAWFSVGVVAAQGRRLRAIGKCSLVLATFSLMLLASFTGYLVPWEELETRPVGEATINRFVILHMVALPIALSLLSLGWWHAFRPTPSKDDVKEPRLGTGAAGNGA